MKSLSGDGLCFKKCNLSFCGFNFSEDILPNYSYTLGVLLAEVLSLKLALTLTQRGLLTSFINTTPMNIEKHRLELTELKINYCVYQRC